MPPQLRRNISIEVYGRLDTILLLKSPQNILGDLVVDFSIQNSGGLR